MSGLMTKEKAVDPPKSAKQTETVRIPADLAKRATIIAVHRDMTVGDLLDPILRGPLEKEFERILKEMGSEFRK